MASATRDVERSFARFVSVVRWVLFLSFNGAFFGGILVREHCATRLDSTPGHYYVTAGRSRTEVSAADYDHFRRLKTLAWTLHWGSVVLGAAWGISLGRPEHLPAVRRGFASSREQASPAPATQTHPGFGRSFP